MQSADASDVLNRLTGALDLLAARQAEFLDSLREMRGARGMEGLVGPRPAPDVHVDTPEQPPSAGPGPSLPGAEVPTPPRQPGPVVIGGLLGSAPPVLDGSRRRGDYDYFAELEFEIRKLRAESS